MFFILKEQKRFFDEIRGYYCYCLKIKFIGREKKFRFYTYKNTNTLITYQYHTKI